MVYYFKIKKEYAISRHPIEIKRSLKNDTKIKEIIDCFIPDQNKFKDEEDKMFAIKAKEFVIQRWGQTFKLNWKKLKIMKKMNLAKVN